MRSFWLVVWGLGIAFPIDPPPAQSSGREKDAFASCRLLGRGINLGNALDAPREGELGITLQRDFFRRIKKAGFDSVRIPIRWSAHAQSQAPYGIDEAFFQRVDWAIEQALARHLAVIINVHHYDEICRDPDTHLPRFLALWKHIGHRYRDQSGFLFFELLNEPHGQLTDERWVRMIPAILAVVRATIPSAR